MFYEKLLNLASEKDHRKFIRWSLMWKLLWKFLAFLFRKWFACQSADVKMKCQQIGFHVGLGALANHYQWQFTACLLSWRCYLANTISDHDMLVWNVCHCNTMFHCFLEQSDSCGDIWYFSAWLSNYRANEKLSLGGREKMLLSSNKGGLQS